MSLAQELIQKQEHLDSERSMFEQLWAEVAPVVFTRQDDFFNKHTSQGERRGKQKFDDTATLALDHGAAAIEGVVSPRGSIWHGIGVPEHLEDDQEAVEWADRLTKFLFKKRYAAESNFASQLHEVYMSLLAFGTGVLIVEDMLDGTIRYKSSHIAEHYFMENSKGNIDVNYRRYELTARQAQEKFGDRTPECVLKALEKNPAQRFEFLHVVMPDTENETQDDFISHHVSIQEAKLISTGSFRSFPYIISRWTTSPNEVYGRGPAISVLSEIKMLNQMRKTDLKARHMAVDPPVLAASKHTIRRFANRPGALNYGSLDEQGNALVKPYNSGVNIAASNDGLEESREFINRAFFLNLFQILVDSPQMTATEVLQRAQEKGQLLTPSAGRQMSELLEPMIMREIDIWGSYGVFEDGQILELPQSMKDAGGEFEVKYTNPLSRMQLADEALGVQRTVESLVAVAQVSEEAAQNLQRVDWREYGDIMRESNGAPAKLFKSDEEMEAILEAKAQQQQIQQLIEAAPQVAGAVKDIAQAQSFSEGE